MAGHDHRHGHHEHGPGHHNHGPGSDQGAKGPGHDHAREHLASRNSDRRRLWLALVITLIICVAEVVGGYLSHSLALLSDAGHMVSDVLGEVLALVAISWSERPANERKTFGYHRIEILMALLQGALLFTMASGVIWSAAHRLSSPPEVQTGTMLIVATIGLLANILCAWLLHGGESMNVKGAYLHVVLDGLSSVAVLAVGVVMAFRHGLTILDPLLSIGIGFFVYYSAYRLARDAVEVLLESVPISLDLDQISAGLLSVPGITHIHDLHVWSIASGMHALSAHLVVEHDNTSGNDALLNQVKDVLARNYRITHSTLQIESDPCSGRERIC